MEYNDLITRVQQASVETPGTDVLLQGVHRTLQHRQKRRQWVVSMVFVLLMGGTVVLSLPTPSKPRQLTLAERVSRTVDAPRSKMPAPLVGYRNSIHNRQIYTLI